MRGGAVCSGRGRRSFGNGRHGTFRVQQMIVARPESEFDEGARVGNRFILPAIVALEFSQRVFGGRVPFSGRLAAQVMLLDQRFLDLLGALGINLLLSALRGLLR